MQIQRTNGLTTDELNSKMLEQQNESETKIRKLTGLWVNETESYPTINCNNYTALIGRGVQTATVEPEIGDLFPHEKTTCAFVTNI